MGVTDLLLGGGILLLDTTALGVGGAGIKATGRRYSLEVATLEGDTVAHTHGVVALGDQLLAKRSETPLEFGNSGTILAGEAVAREPALAACTLYELETLGSTLVIGIDHASQTVMLESLQILSADHVGRRGGGGLITHSARRETNDCVTTHEWGGGFACTHTTPCTRNGYGLSGIGT